MYYASNGIKTIVIRRDPSPESPRDSDYQSNLGKMVCWHRRHSLGDKHQYADIQEFAMQLASNYLNSGDIFHAVHAGQIDNCRLIPVSQKTINGKFIDPHYELQTYGGLPGYESWQGTGWRCT